jgi:anti-anti-sigma factor
MTTADTFDTAGLDAYLGFNGDTAVVHLSGMLDESRVPVLRALLEQALARPALDRLVLRMHGLSAIAPGGVRCIAFAHQRLAAHVPMVLDGAGEQVRTALGYGGVAGAVTLTEPATA